MENEPIMFMSRATTSASAFSAERLLQAIEDLSDSLGFMEAILEPVIAEQCRKVSDQASLMNVAEAIERGMRDD